MKKGGIIKVGQLFMNELKKLAENRKMLISVIVVILVPLVYAAILLSPDWGPYDNLDNVPVAVVNNDKGSMSNGEPIHAGDDLVENLKNTDGLGWDFVTSEEASRGMDNLEYYMVIEVPEDFSENVVTVLDPEPIKPKLKYIQNEGLHFIAAQATETAIETIQGQLSTQITETYVRNVFEQLGGVTDGFQEAADGSGEIHDGSNQLRDGTTEILDNLTGKSGDISELADGAQQLEDGAGEILFNLQDKSADISKLAAGAQEANDGTGLLLSTLREKSSDIQELADGSDKLSSGAQELQAGVDQLVEGAKTAKDGSFQLKQGLNKQLVPGSEELVEGVEQAQEGVHDTIDSMETLLKALHFLSDFDKSEPLYDVLFNEVVSQVEISIYGSEEDDIPSAEDKKADFARLVAGANELSRELKEGSDFNAGLTQLDQGLKEIVIGQNELKAGADELAAGASQIADGNQTVKAGWDELEANVAILHDGVTQIKDGNLTVASGWQELTDGSMQLHDGATQISEGTQTVETGWGDLTDGVTQVDDGVGQIQDGSDELTEGLLGGVEDTSQLNPSDENMAMFAAPVELDGEIINEFSLYRDSMAPYVMTLALFAGILAMSFVLEFRKPAVMPTSGISWFAGKVMNLSIFAIIQAIIISSFTLLFLKLQVQSSFMFILFSIGISLVFLMFVMFLVALAGNVGRFIALAFVVLQLSITGSDLPIHMLPEGFRTLSNFLPFTYSIDAYKNIVTLGKFSRVWSNATILALYLVVFAGLSLLVYHFRYRNIDVSIAEKAS